MISTILSAFRVAEIRKKLLFTAAILALYRLGSFIPVPGVDIDAVEQIQKNYSDAGSSACSTPSRVAGCRGSRCSRSGSCRTSRRRSSCSCCVVVSPALEKLQKEGEVGQARITQYTRYLTVGLAAAQAIGYTFLFRSQGAAGTPVFENFNAGT